MHSSRRGRSHVALKRTPIRRRTQLRGIGKRKKREIVETKDARQAYLAAHIVCEIGEVLRLHRDVDPAAQKGSDECLIKATCVHERKKRSQHGSLVQNANLMASCVLCNDWVERNPGVARELGLTVLSHEDPASVLIPRSHT